MLWEYQKELAGKAKEILEKHKIVYLAMEMRVGKTLIALETCRLMEFCRVLFVTKKKAIKSIYEDYKREGFLFQLDIVNYENLHKVYPRYDAIIVDEAHCVGAFPKPNLRAKRLKKLVGENYLLLLSGTPTPESYSQIFHQLWLSSRSPFPEKNFYQWAKEYVKPYKIFVNGMEVKRYDNAIYEKIQPRISKYFLTYTREEAGFEITQGNEYVLRVRMKDETYALARRLIKRGVADYEGSLIVADTGAKRMWKAHQIFSGTVIDEKGKGLIIDKTKAEFIREKFQNKKIVIFYKYQAELEMLKEIFPEYVEEPKWIKPNHPYFSQIQSGSMGLDFSNADALVFLNIDFSATLYWQARARAFHKQRETTPDICWVFAEEGIEEKVYQVVRRKKDYTLSYFKKDFLLSNTIKNDDSIGFGYN